MQCVASSACRGGEFQAGLVFAGVSGGRFGPRGGRPSDHSGEEPVCGPRLLPASGGVGGRVVPKQSSESDDVLRPRPSRSRGIESSSGCTIGGGGDMLVLRTGRDPRLPGQRHWLLKARGVSGVEPDALASRTWGLCSSCAR